MKRVSLLVLTAFLSLHCEHQAEKSAALGSGGAAGDAPGSAGAAVSTSAGTGTATGGRPGTGGAPSVSTSGSGGKVSMVAGGDEGKYPEAFDPNDSAPKVGEQGCGFDRAAFCDTFGGPSVVRGRARELDSVFWSAGRGKVQLSNVRAIGIGMAQIPQCREGLPSEVWTKDDSLVCQPTNDILSGHFMAAAATQYYGQQGYRIRQPFDFAGRTGKIVFDGTVSPLSPLHGWISLAITEDPMLTPGYSILGNDEGSIIPKNAVEVHFVNAPGNQGVQVRNIHVFRDYVDTLYTPDPPAVAPYKPGKLNHYEVSISTDGVEVAISPYSDDGVTFAAPTAVYKLAASVPFSRGWVQLSVHNHATIKYTEPDSGYASVVDAAVGLFDNVGFDGPVLANWREYEIPDSLVKYNEDDGDPHNAEHVGYDIGYAIQDAAQGPKQTLKLEGVDLTKVQSAQLSFTVTVDYLSSQFPRDQHTFRARLNGGKWLERKLTAAEAAFLDPNGGPTVIDPSGKPVGDPGSQGRFALSIDVPLEELKSGDNTLEFVSANVPTGNPPVVYNIDLVMKLTD
ncbi:MAG TPA: hypothetical protein VER11_23180 [Polyangiaceae bacterium]|nr:hypothetical protein [Polyangiaceae bacterium]